MSGKLIVIEGTDGSGKETQSKRLLERLEESGIKTAYADFPQHGQKSCGMVDNYLNEKYGPANSMDPKVASMFYAVDRYDASFEIRKRLEEDRVVVCNRYVSANMGHQGGKIKDEKERRDYVEWLKELEYDFFKIPRPDMTILLYVPYLISQGLVKKKKQRAYIEKTNMDGHENNPEHLKNAEAAFLDIAKYENWCVINCTKNGEMLDIEEIHNEVWGSVKAILRI
jgi:dTMP kinase